MPRRHRKTKRGGGMFDSLSTSFSSLWKPKASPPMSSSTPPMSSSTPPMSSSTPPMTSSTYGGKSRKHRRRMRGGFKDNTPVTGLASHAASFSGQTAKPHTLVGGKTRRRRKSRTHRRR
jgi:hypothetical protein